MSRILGIICTTLLFDQDLYIVNVGFSLIWGVSFWVDWRSSSSGLLFLGCLLSTEIKLNENIQNFKNHLILFLALLGDKAAESKCFGANEGEVFMETPNAQDIIMWFACGSCAKVTLLINVIVMVGGYNILRVTSYLSIKFVELTIYMVRKIAREVRSFVQTAISHCQGWRNCFHVSVSFSFLRCITSFLYFVYGCGFSCSTGNPQYTAGPYVTTLNVWPSLFSPPFPIGFEHLFFNWRKKN